MTTLPFTFTISAPPGQRARVRAEWLALAQEVRDVIPGASSVTVVNGAVTVLNDAQEALNLEHLPWSLHERLCELLGYGAFRFPGPGERGSEVEEPYSPGPSRALGPGGRS